MDGAEVAKPKCNTHIGDYNNMLVKQKIYNFILFFVSTTPMENE
jgi:hypothetical protein